jgi:hypothetical protein
VTVEGHPGMDMKIKHLSLPPKTAGTPLAEPLPAGSAPP